MQFMVDMACQSCVSKVKASLQGVQGALLLQLGGSLRPVDASRAGISTVSADLSTQTVLVEGTATVEALLSAITTSGLNARLVGQGSVTGASSLDEHGLAPPPADRLAHLQASARSWHGRWAWTCGLCASPWPQCLSSRATPGARAMSSGWSASCR